MQQQEIKDKQINNLKLDNFIACMVLSGSGDSMGYKNGSWQFNTSGKIIYQQMMQLTNNKGVLFLDISLDKGWRYSDDTVMHIATANGLIKAGLKAKFPTICQAIAVEYKQCWNYMSGRAPGKTTGKMIKVLNVDGSNWNKIPYADRACGCGGSMRSACIGLAFNNIFQKKQNEPSDLSMLIGVSIQAGRMTHHNPVGYLGSMVSSFFTALAIQNVDIRLWPAYLFEVAFPQSQKYVKQAKRQVQLNFSSGYWQRFVQAWADYAKKRNLSLKIGEIKQPEFGEKYNQLIERQHFYKSLAWNGWPGALGIDSVLIAYDALLSCNGSWEQFCLRGILHGGDNDSTGAIGAAWFGALYGFKGVPKVHYKGIEDIGKLCEKGKYIYNMVTANPIKK